MLTLRENNSKQRISSKKNARLAESDAKILALVVALFCKTNYSRWANIGACATFCAEIRIDLVDIARRDSFYGAFGLTRTTRYTAFVNYVCHCFFSFAKCSTFFS